MICQGAYDGKLNFVHCACVMSYISQYINLIRCFMCYAWLTSCILIPCGCCHGRAVQRQWTFDSMSFNIWDFFSPRLRFSIGHCYFITLALTMYYFISSPWSRGVGVQEGVEALLEATIYERNQSVMTFFSAALRWSSVPCTSIWAPKGIHENMYERHFDHISSQRTIVHISFHAIVHMQLPLF